MAYDEDEQLEALKDWWRENGRSVITGVVLGIGVVAGWQGWNWYNDSRAEQAAVLYEPILQAERTDRGTIEPVASELTQSHARSGYAALAALSAAGAAAADGDLDAAADWLRWVHDEAQKPSLRHLARGRLARVLGEQGDVSAALQLLRDDVPEGFAGLYAEIEGDLLLTDGRTEAAAEAYERALDVGTGLSNRQLVEMKHNRALGDAGTVAAAETGSDGDD